MMVEGTLQSVAATEVRGIFGGHASRQQVQAPFREPCRMATRNRTTPRDQLPTLASIAVSGTGLTLG